MRKEFNLLKIISTVGNLIAMKSVQTIRAEGYCKDFPITSICRADLEQAGFSATNVDDDIMSELASKMANAYCDLGFWEDLKVLAEDLGIKKHRKPKSGHT